MEDKDPEGLRTAAEGPEERAARLGVPRRPSADVGPEEGPGEPQADPLTAALEAARARGEELATLENAHLERVDKEVRRLLESRGVDLVARIEVSRDGRLVAFPAFVIRRGPPG